MEQPKNQQTDPETNSTPDITPKSSSTVTISLRNLTAHVALGRDAWSRPSKLQPLHLSVYLTKLIDDPPYLHSSSSSSSSAPSSDTATIESPIDTLANTTNYSTLAKDITTVVSGQAFLSLEHVTHAIEKVAERWPGQKLKIEVKAPKAFVRGDGLERTVSLRAVRFKPVLEEPERSSSNGEGNFAKQDFRRIIEEHDYTLPCLRIACIIGVNPHERVEKQDVVFKIRFLLRSHRYAPPPVPTSGAVKVIAIEKEIYLEEQLLQRERQHQTQFQSQSQTQPETQPRQAQKIASNDPDRLDIQTQLQTAELNWQTLVRRLCRLIEATSFQTVEALGHHIASWLLDTELADVSPVRGVTVTVEKPAALVFVEAAGAEVTRMKLD